jgi:hypothetical protein
MWFRRSSESQRQDDALAYQPSQPGAGLADVAHQPFRKRRPIMFKLFAVTLLAATIFSGPVLAQAPAPSSAPAAADKSAKPAHHEAHKAHHEPAKAKPAAASTTGAATSNKKPKKGHADTVHENPR